MFSLFFDITVPVACLTLTKIFFAGSYTVALAAQHYSVPLIVLASVYKLTPKFIPRADQQVQALTDFIILKIRFKPIAFALFFSMFCRKRRS